VIDLLCLWRFITSNLFFRFWDNGILFLILNNWSFDILGFTRSRNCIFCSWLFFLLYISILIRRFAVLDGWMWEEIFVANWLTSGLSTSTCPFCLLCTQCGWFYANGFRVLFLDNICRIDATGVPFLCWDVLTFDLWLRLRRIVDILPLDELLAGLADYPGFIYSHLFSLVGNLRILVLFSRPNPQGLFARRDPIHLALNVHFLFLLLLH
jgi:hypothetical protein